MNAFQRMDVFRPTETNASPTAKPQKDSKMAPAHDHLDEVQRRATAILRGSPYSPVQRLDCAHEEGVLTVSGRVPRFYLKQHALMLAKKVPGVFRIEDRIEVGEGNSPVPAAEVEPAGATVRMALATF